MEQLLQYYQQEVERIQRLQRALASVIDTTVSLIPIEALGEVFNPSEQTLSLQLRNWPEGMFPIPPAAWVEPREGMLNLAGMTWKYVFHGNGVSVTNLTTGAKVGAQFSAAGEYALTPWIVYMHLKHSSIEEPLKSQLLTNNEELFRELERIGRIVPVPPRLPRSDPTFVLREVAQ